MTKLITVDFHDDTLFAVERPDGVFVAPKPICDALGIEWRKQRERIQRDPILSEGSTMMGLPSVGGEQETTVLRIELLQGWLFGIDAERVKPEARDRVLAYKRECYAALHAHFYGRRNERAGQNDHTFETHPGCAEPMRFRRQLVADAYRIFGIRAAGQLWQKLGLPDVPAMFEGERQGSFGFTYTAVRQDAPSQPQGGK